MTFGYVQKADEDTVLHKSAAGAVVSNDTLDTEVDPLGIRYFVAEVLVLGNVLKWLERRDESLEGRTV